MAAPVSRESSFCEKDYRSELLRALYIQKQNKTFCDVIMKVGDCELHLHSLVLAAASPYFNNFLTADSPRHYSQRSPQIIEIQIEGSNTDVIYKDAVETIIDFLYTGTIHINTQTVTHISELARIMQLKSVVKHCEDFVSNRQETSPDPSSVVPPAASRTSDFGVSTEADDFADAQSATSRKNDHPNAIVNPTRIMAMSHLSTATATKMFKQGRLVSAATQVTPVLLGILPPSPKKTRDMKTQTLVKDFPERVKGQQCGRVGRRRSTNISEETEIVLEITRSAQKSASVRLLPNRNDSFKLGEGAFVKEETSFEAENQREPIETDANDSFIVVESENNIGVAIDIENEDLDVDYNSRRRSGRRPKPTPKILALKRTATSPAKGSPLKVRQVTTTEEKQDENKAITNDDSPKKSPRKSILVPREECVYIVEDAPPEETSNTVLEGVEIKQENITSDEQLNELILYTDAVPEPEDESSKILRKPRRPGIRRNRKGFFRFTCGECEFRTNKVREFTSHKRLHKMENNICYYCEEKFENKDDLTEHFQRHKGPLPFFCPVCECRFKARTQLNIHLPKHSDDKPFVCEVCSAGFKWKHALKSHMIVHSNRKDHLCDECGYATAHKCQLKAHKLIHTGQTYRCNFSNCKFQATKRQNLKYHLLTHTREKPHQCEICGQSFSLIKNMRRHMLLHSTDKPHHCNECEFSTTRYDKLKEHRLKSHGMGSPPEKRIRVSDLVEQNIGEDGTMEESEGDKMLSLELREEGVAPEDSSVTNGAIAMTHHEELVQTGEGGEEVRVLSEAQTMQFLPGHTIIITQTGHDGEIQTHEVTIPPSTGLLQATAGAPVQNGVQFTEVMIPSTQLNEYVQELTFVEPT